MRSFLLLACLGMSAIGLAGCTASSKGIDALGLDRLKPSTETTSSIPRPNAPVSEAAAQSQSMLVAQLLLCVGFLLFLTYPAVARVLGE